MKEKSKIKEKYNLLISENFFNDYIKECLKKPFLNLNVCHHDDGGKLAGFLSLSTCSFLNSACMVFMEKSGFVCCQCYAVRDSLRYVSDDPTENENNNNCLAMLKRQIENTIKLTKSILKLSDIILLGLQNVKYFRLESFGDLINETQFLNYIKIVKYYKGVNFALWTKHPDIIFKYVKNNKLPKNLIIVFSDPVVNGSAFFDLAIDRIKKYCFPYQIKKFIVYDSKTAKKLIHQNGKAFINCGGKKCLDCLNCYDRKKKVDIIREILK